MPKAKVPRALPKWDLIESKPWRGLQLQPLAAVPAKQRQKPILQLLLGACHELQCLRREAAPSAEPMGALSAETQVSAGKFGLSLNIWLMQSSMAWSSATSGLWCALKEVHHIGVSQLVTPGQLCWNTCQGETTIAAAWKQISFGMYMPSQLLQAFVTFWQSSYKLCLFGCFLLLLALVLKQHLGSKLKMISNSDSEGCTAVLKIWVHRDGTKTYWHVTTLPGGLLIF